MLCLLHRTATSNIQRANHENEKSDKRAMNSGYRNYDEVISKNAETQTGLFTFHKVDDKYYFEIPESLLEKEILVATKVSGHVQAKGISNGAGSQPHSQQIIRFQRKDNVILMRLINYDAVADKELPIYHSVRSNNFETVVYSFKIEAIGKGLDSYVIDIKDFFTTDVFITAGLKEYEKGKFGVSGVDSSRSLIEWVKVFPENVEVRHVLTYKATKHVGGLMSLQLNQSFILLPDDLMVPRFYDERVGYFSFSQIDYGLDAHKAISREYILKRRLEPSNREAYNKGELVEPIKPIVYYIDPATPVKWREYIMQGVEDWQKAFEKIGFKNAVVAKNPPTPEEDPDWHPEDIRYSVIRYQARTGQSANGPTIYDPRTGEIIESDILFNHNMMNLLGRWFFVRTAAANPDAQGPKLKDEIMGRLIQTVITHEVGHTLGLMHNSLSLASYPIDSLRSPTFTSKYGTGESIMDFTFNYIAQPEDSVTNFYNQLSAYDFLAIQYGYKPILDADSPDEEMHIINQWIKKKSGNPIYRFGHIPSLLGDDPLMAADLGIMNLKRIMNKLIDWSVEEGKGNKLLSERYEEIIIKEFGWYMFVVSENIGKVGRYNTISDQAGVAYRCLPFSTQKESIEFLNKHLFDTPHWLVEKQILGLISEHRELDNSLKYIQEQRLYNLLIRTPQGKILKNEKICDSDDYYSVINLFSDLREGIFTEVRTGKPIDVYRRNLQKIMISHLEKIIDTEDPLIYNSDLPSIARHNLIVLSEEIRKGRLHQMDKISRFHLEDLLVRIDKVLKV